MTVGVERERLVDWKCPADCPHPQEDEWHEGWAERCANGAPHRHDGRQMTHAHFPKKGMGGNNPLSKVVAYICWPLHDSADNGLNGMGIAVDEVRFWDVHNRTILRGPVPGASSDGGETPSGGVGAVMPDTAPVSPPSPDVSHGVGPSSEGAVPPAPSPNSADGASSDGTQGQYGKALSPSGESPGTAEALGPSPDVSASVEAQASEGGGTRLRTPPSPNLADDAGRDGQGADSFPETTRHAPATASPSIAESLKPKILPAECLLEEALEIAKRIGTAKNDNPWDAGDWVLETEARWPHEYAQGVKYLGYNEHSLLNVVRVCRTFRDVQRDIATFTHYQTSLKVASELGVDKAVQWLKRAAVAEWSVTEFRRQLGEYLPDLYSTKPRTVRFSVDELRERAEGFTATEHRNHGARFLAAFLESLE